MKGKIAISGGAYRGRTIKVPSKIRPTQSIVRKSIFDSLGAWIKGKAVLEIFSGSGAVGIEAISRGALLCCFIDKSQESILKLKENIKLVDKDNRIIVLKGDYVRILNSLIGQKRKFDFIFADPPYAFNDFSRLFDKVLPLMSNDSIFVLEHKTDVPPYPDFTILKEAKFGQTRTTYYSSLPGDL